MQTKRHQPRMPDKRPRVSAARRAALLDQLRYLIEEVEASKEGLARVPDAVICQRFDGRPSVAELYASIATRDRDVLLPMVTGRHAKSAEQTCAGALDDILCDVQEARRELVSALEGVPLEAWSGMVMLERDHMTVYELLQTGLQRNVDALRAIARRLHRSP